MVEQRHGHKAKPISLDTIQVHQYGDEYMITSPIQDRNKRNLRLETNIADTLFQLLDNPAHCQSCGGLVPELAFTWNNHTFHFFCYEIRKGKRGTVVNHTQFQRLHDYLNKHPDPNY